MKITNVTAIVVRAGGKGDWVFVEVHTDEGITGLGEASQSMNDQMLLAALDAFRPALIGRDPLGINAIWRNLARVDGGRITHTALSGIEQALWDIAGQRAGLPLHTLFGGAVRRRVRLYANINRHVTERTPEGFARAAKDAVSEGFTAIKLAPFDLVGDREHVRRGPEAAWVRGVECVEAVREAVGSEVELAVDCHGRMEASEAVIVGRELSRLGLLWYEEPVRRNHPDQLRLVSRELGVPCASAEGTFGVEGFRPFLTERVVDVLMPDVKHCGGLREMLNIAEAARMHDLLIAPHNPAGPVSTMGSAHVVATLANFLILEYAWGEIEERLDLLDPPEPLNDGHLEISDRPGVGHSLNRDVVENLRVK
jgi:galactonate dehydratase